MLIKTEGKGIVSMKKQIRKFLVASIVLFLTIGIMPTRIFAEEEPSNLDEEVIEVEEENTPEEETEALPEEILEEVLVEETLEESEEVVEELPEEVVEETEALVEETKEAELPAEKEEAPAEEAPIEEAPVETEFYGKAVIDGVIIEVTADAGVFPEGSTLRAVRSTAAQKEIVNEAIEKADGQLEIAEQYTFDITILDAEGNEIQPDTEKGKVNVSFSTEEVADESLEATVYHIDDNGNAETLEVETEGETATVETEGFSQYSLVFTHVVIVDGKVVSHTATLFIGEQRTLWSLLNSFGVTEENHGNITTANTDDDTIIDLFQSENTWYVRALRGDSRQHRITVYFANGAEEQIIITSHIHHWVINNTGAKATFECDAPLCDYEDEYSVTISASNATYNGAAHGASRSTTSFFPSGDVHIGNIVYEGINGTNYGASTEAPVNAGNYKASLTVTCDAGGSTTISTTYTIYKANINVTAPTAYTLTYNGEAQVLHTTGSGHSATTDKEFTMLYADGSATDKSEFKTNKRNGTDAGTYAIKYFVPGDANHNDSPITTLSITINRKAVNVGGIKANSKVYDGTRTAVLNTSEAYFNGIVSGDSLSVTTTTGLFDNKNVGSNKEVTFSITLGGDDRNNYYVTNNSQVSTTANITRKALVIKWYGAGNVSYTGEVILPEARLERSSNLSSDDGLAYLSDDIKVSVQQMNNGKQNPSIDKGNGYRAVATGLYGADANNYTINPGSVNVDYNIVDDLVVINWNANSLVKMYNGGLQNPTITSISGIQPEDVNHIHARVIGTGRKDVGIYVIAAELYADAGYEAKLANYHIDSSSQTYFEITKAPLTIKASGWMIYGEIFTPEVAHATFECEGLLGNDTKESALIGLDTVNYEGDIHQQFAPVGNYDILVDSRTLSSNNYELRFAKGTLVVYPRPVQLDWYNEEGEIVTSVNNSRTYDSKFHTLTAKVVGTNDANVMVFPMNNGGTHNDTVYVTEYENNTKKDSNLKAGIWPYPYVAHALALNNPNYTLLADPHAANPIEDVTATQDWFINPYRIELAWNHDELMYNAKDQWDSVTANAINLFEGDEIDPTYNVEYAKDVDEYVKEVVDLGNDNYTYYVNNCSLEGEKVATQSHTWNITKAPLTIRAEGWIFYGETHENVRKLSNDEAGVDYIYVTSQGEKLLEEDIPEEQINFTEAAFTSTYNQFDGVSYPGFEWDDEINKGKYEILASGLTAKNYEITFEADHLEVYPKPVELTWVDEEGDDADDEFSYVYNGEMRKVEAKVDEASYAREEDKEILVTEYAENEKKDSCAKAEVEAYTAKALALDNDNYTLLADPKNDKETFGTTTSFDWIIKQLPVKLTWEAESYIYNGKEQLAMAKDNQVAADDVKFEYADQSGLHTGDYHTTVTAVNDLNYTLENGENLEADWRIEPLPVEIKWDADKKVYNDEAQKVIPTIANIVEGDEATLTVEDAEDAINVGKYTTVITGVDNEFNDYTLEGGKNLEQKWEITPLSIKNAKVTGIATKIYTAKAITQTPTLNLKVGKANRNLVLDKEFTLTFKNNKNVGTATITIKGTGNFKDTITKTFTIKSTISLNKTALTVGTMKVGKYSKTLQLKATVNSNNKKVTWTSSDPKIAKVDANGNVTGVSDPKHLVSTVTITATTSDGQKATCKVTVEDPVSAFIRRLYKYCLNRNPDKQGFDYWYKNIKTKKMSAADAVKGFFESNEMKKNKLSNAETIERCYLTMMNRKSDKNGKNYWIGVYSKQGRMAVLRGFVNSNEFTKICKDYDVMKGSIK